jgi:hypothetical protein
MSVRKMFTLEPAVLSAWTRARIRRPLPNPTPSGAPHLGRVNRALDVPEQTSPLPVHPQKSRTRTNGSPAPHQAAPLLLGALNPMTTAVMTRATCPSSHPRSLRRGRPRGICCLLPLPRHPPCPWPDHHRPLQMWLFVNHLVLPLLHHLQD